MKKILKTIQGEKGVAFLMVLSALLVLYVFAASFAILIANEVRMVRKERYKLKSFYISESGLQQGIAKGVRYPNKSNAALAINVPDFGRKFGSWGTEANANEYNYTVVFTDVDNKTKKVTSTGKTTDTSGGVPVTVESIQSQYYDSPFRRTMWSDGTIHFRNPDTCLPPRWFGANPDAYFHFTGQIYSRKMPIVEANISEMYLNNYYAWGKRYCIRPCVWIPFVGTKCWCIYCPVTGVKYWVNNIEALKQCHPNITPSQGLHIATGKTGLPADEVKPGCVAGETRLSTYGAESEGVNGAVAPYDKDYDAMPFPQFSCPEDPRIPGSSSNLQYMTGEQAKNFVVTNRYLKNVWVDGDIDLRMGWAAGLGTIKVGIYGTVYVHGRVLYTSGWFVTKLLLFTEGQNMNGPEPSDQLGASTGPGNLIIDTGDLELTATGDLLGSKTAIDTGNVNIVMTNGNLKLRARDGKLRGSGLYYAKGDVGIYDHDAWALISGWWVGTTEYKGTYIAKDIYFSGKYDHTFDSSLNVNLEIPEGFYSAVRVYNYKEEK